MQTAPPYHCYSAVTLSGEHQNEAENKMEVEHKLLDAAQIDSTLSKLGKITTRYGLEAHVFKVGSFPFYVCLLCFAFALYNPRFIMMFSLINF